MCAHSASPRQIIKAETYDELVAMTIRQIDQFLQQRTLPYIRAVTQEELIDLLLAAGVGSSPQLRGKRRRTRNREKAIVNELYQTAMRRERAWRIVNDALRQLPAVRRQGLTHRQAARMLDWKTLTLVVSDACVVLGTRDHRHPRDKEPLLRMTENDRYADNPPLWRHVKADTTTRKALQHQ